MCTSDGFPQENIPVWVENLAYKKDESLWQPSRWRDYTLDGLVIRGIWSLTDCRLG